MATEVLDRDAEIKMKQKLSAQKKVLPSFYNLQNKLSAPFAPQLYDVV